MYKTILQALKWCEKCLEAQDINNAIQWMNLAQRMYQNKAILPSVHVSNEIERVWHGITRLEYNSKVTQ